MIVGVRRKIVEGGREKTWVVGQLARGLREGKNGKKQNFTILMTYSSFHLNANSVLQHSGDFPYTI